MKVENYNEKVSDALHKLGISNTIGYFYLKDAIAARIEKGMRAKLVFDIYADVAKTNGTTTSRVERAIRYSIQRACITADKMHEKLGVYVAFARECPTNGDFINAMAEILTR